MKTLSTEQLRSLVAFADCGSLRGAAEIVRRSEAALSVQMRKLETDVGRPLFRRVGKRMALTDFGEETVEDARRILQLNVDILSKAQGADVRGELRIGAPDDYLSLMPPVLREIRQSFPNLRVEIVCQPSGDLRALLKENALDASMLSAESDTGEGVVLHRLPLVWAGARNWRRGDEPTPLALFPDGCIIRKWALNTLSLHRIAHRVAYTSGNIRALQLVVENGLAVAPFIKLDVPPGCREVPDSEGLPPLPAITLMLCFSSRIDSRIRDFLSMKLMA